MVLHERWRPLQPQQWAAFDEISERLRKDRRHGDGAAELGYRMISAAACPPDLAQLIERLRSCDGDAVAPAARWLRADPFCLHSGYAKERILRYLPRNSLSAATCGDLRSLLLDLVRRGGRPEFRVACRVAARVQDEQFRCELESLTGAPRGGVADRAGWMLAACRRALDAGAQESGPRPD